MSSSRRFTRTLPAAKDGRRETYHIAQGAFAAPRCHIQVNAPAGSCPEEYAEIARLVRSAIDGERYVLSPRVKRLKSILAKLDPAPSATVTPYPAPRPSAEPSFLYAKLRGVRRRR